MTVTGLSDRKQVSTQTSTGTSSQTVPDTPDIVRARQDTAQVDPSIGYRLGDQQRQLNESFASPTGGYVTPQIRDAIKRSQGRELMQEAGAQTRAGQYDVNRLNQSKDLALAGLTRGVNETGTSSGTGTVKQSQSPWATVAQVGATAGPAMSM